MKMKGIVKWYKDVKGYGYIMGGDGETYFFEKINCLDPNCTYSSGDEVLFIPEFLELDYAKEVERVKENE